METLDVSRLEPLKGRFKWMVILKMAFVALNIIFVFYLVHLSGLSKSIDAGNENAAYQFQDSMMWMVLIGFLIFCVYVGMVVTTLLWIYRAGLNLHLAGLKGLRFTPGWYVGWFFIPVAWWFMPFMALSEIGKGSAAIKDKNNWQQQPIPRILVVWYVFFLGYFVYGVINYALRKPEPDIADPLLKFAKQVPDMVVPSIIGVIMYSLYFVPSLLFALKVTREQQANIIND